MSLRPALTNDVLQALIDRIDRIIDDHAAKFPPYMRSEIGMLEDALAIANETEMREAARRLKGGGETFGWPQITAAAVSLLKTLEDAPTDAGRAISLKRHLEALQRLSVDKMKGQTAAGWHIVRTLNPSMD